MSNAQPFFEAFVSSWTFDAKLFAALAVSAAIYLHGWRILHSRDPQRWHRVQVSAFIGGLAAIYLALASPIESFSFLLLRVHMVQHLLLMAIAPPLFWLGDPLFPFLRGVPKPIRVYWIGPLFRSPTVRRFLGRLTHPITAWLIFVVANWSWHMPRFYELALRSDNWHYVQHLCFLAAGLIFWYPVVRPYPSRPRWPRWLLFPYLIFADIQNTVLAALLTLSDRVLYPHYSLVPRLDGASALDDQMTAGVIMWVPGSVAFLIPLFIIGWRWLAGANAKGGRAESSRPASSIIGGPRRLDPPYKAIGRVPLPMATPSNDLLRVPFLGRFLRWRHARLALQIPLLLLASVLIYDGLTGTEIAPLNLAGVLPWIHWRGFLILGLLVGGNVFCTACPFVVPRTLARKFLPQPFAWPRRFRNKWLAVALVMTFLWAYEAFALWDSPWLTAWIILGYFAGALAVDGLFRGAAFCKYVCPIGQFNFVQSLVSPFEVKVRDSEVCSSCATMDCIRGRPAEFDSGRLRDPARQGCELNLFLPRKSSNMDCTMCLDCIHACPHDNIGIVATLPARELWRDRRRSGIGRFSQRFDVAALVLVLVFGAFANAAGMTAPVVDAQEWLQAATGLGPNWIVTVYYFAALALVPTLVIACAAEVSRRWARIPMAGRELATRFAFALVPLGFAMWLTHYSFHFLTSYDAILPAIQRFAADLGFSVFDWVEPACACCRPVLRGLLHLEILCLDVGLLLSLYTGYRIAADVTHVRTARALAPWVLLIIALFAVGIWIVLQPMQMRGTLGMAWSS